jgi:FlaA1/EpsC-like NDP-sugar epimerase
MLATLQHLRIRYPRWVVAWGIYFTDAIFSSFAFLNVFVPIIYERAQYSSLELFIIFIALQIIYGVIFLPLNLYNSEPTTSRFYEIQQVVRSTFLLALLAVFYDALYPGTLLFNAQEILRYWLLLSIGLTISRWSFRSLQKYLLTQGDFRWLTISV